MGLRRCLKGGDDSASASQKKRLFQKGDMKMKKIRLFVLVTLMAVSFVFPAVADDLSGTVTILMTMTPSVPQ